MCPLANGGLGNDPRELARLFTWKRPMAVKRVWHGWTTPENADAYRAVLETRSYP